MRPPKILTLQQEEKKALEQRFRNDGSAAVRSRCQVILLKAQGRSAEDIASITAMCTITVHSWIKRYRSEGMDGLETKDGRGRKKLLSEQPAAAAAAVLVTQSIREHRQSLKAAKAAYEAAGGKPVSDDTFRRFLKALATPIKESAGGWVKKRTKHSMSTK